MHLLLPFRWLLLLPLLVGNAWAQSQPAAPITFGTIDPQDLTAAPFAADSAAAVVLCDYGTVTILGNENGELRFDRVIRIKILKKAGLGWGNGEVPVSQARNNITERLTNLRGFTYNLTNGQVVRDSLTKAGQFKEEKADGYALHKFALPNVRAGSVVEYRYTLFCDYLLPLRTWQFQHAVPVRWSEYRAAIPAQYAYRMFVQSSRPLTVEEKTNANSLLPRFRWAMRDVPPLPSEPFMPNAADYTPKVFFELSSVRGHDVVRTWEQLDSYIIDDWEYGRQFEQFGFMKPQLARLPAPTPANARERVAAVRALVCQAVLCTSTRGLRASAPLRTVFLETHRGTVGDVNRLLVAALRGAGYPAQPVLLSTRSHGRVRTTSPQINQFNYLAAHVQLPDGQELVLDATDPLLPYDMLPEACLNQQARLVGDKPGTSRWLELKPRHRATHLQQVQLRLAPDGALSGQVHEELAGYAGSRVRARLKSEGEKKLNSLVQRAMAGWAIENLTIANRDSVEKPLVLDYAVAQPGQTAAGPKAGTMYLSPLQAFGLGRNPLPAETRQLPVDFGYAQDEMLQVTLTLPPGYELAQPPTSRAFDLPDNGGRYAYSVSAAGATVQLTSRLTLRKPQYAAGEYGPLRELYRQLLEKHAEKLVIQKKAG